MRRPGVRNLSIEIPYEWIAAAIAEQLPSLVNIDRHRAMVERLGEACTVKDAAKAMSCSECTVRRMMADGRLASACGGMRVDTRSLADLIETRGMSDETP